MTMTSSREAGAALPGDTVSYSELMRRGVEDGTGIPRPLYVDEAVFDLEIEHIFNRSWLYAGHASQLAETGSYVTVDSGAESVIVARTEDGALAAYENVCRHRGARLLDGGCGQTQRLVCPYHQWAYRLDGSLQGAPKMGADFRREEHSLLPVRVGTWHGLVFINLASDPADVSDVSDVFAVAEPVIGPYRLERAKVAHRITYDVDANWKIMWENGQECYHCSANHPEFARTFEVSPAANPAAAGMKALASADRRVQVAQFSLKPGAVSLTMDGTPASAVRLGDYSDGRTPQTASVSLTPMFAVVCSADYAAVVYDRPLSSSRTQVTMEWLVAESAVAGVDYDVDNLIRVWDRTNEQDWELCARTQLGVQSRRYAPGPLAPDERAIAGFHRAYADLLAAAER